MNEDSPIQVRKVRVLLGAARKQALDMGLAENDLVIMRKDDSMSSGYSLEKIEGSPIEYLQKHLK